MKRNCINRINSINIVDLPTHSSRSFFVYTNGDLFCQLTAYEMCIANKDDNIVLNMRGAIIRGKFVTNHGTGIILSDWTIKTIKRK